MPEMRIQPIQPFEMEKVVVRLMELGKELGYEGDAHKWIAMLTIASQVLADEVGIRTVKMEESDGPCGLPGCKNCEGDIQ